MILTPLQKMPNNVGGLGKIIVATSFEWLPQVQKIAKSGHTDWVRETSSYLISLFRPLASVTRHLKKNCLNLPIKLLSSYQLKVILFKIAQIVRKYLGYFLGKFVAKNIQKSHDLDTLAPANRFRLITIEWLSKPETNTQYQCDQLVRLFVQYLAIYIDESLRQSEEGNKTIQSWLKFIPNYSKSTLNKCPKTF